MEPLISIVVPVYNVEQYLGESIKSLLAQTYRNIEIILVDDGSTDNCPIICDRYAKQDMRVKVLHKKNGGLSDARNKGIDIARGEYIGFVDSDDWVEPNMYEVLLKSIINDKSDISVCGIIREYKNGTVSQGNIAETMSQNEAVKALLDGNIIHDHAWSKLYKKDLFAEVRYPKGMVYEDIRTTYKLFLKSNKISIVSKCLYHYRQRRGSIIRNGFTEKKLEWLDAVKALKKDYRLNPYNDIVNYRIVKTECLLLRELALYGSKENCKQYKRMIIQFKQDINKNRNKLLNDKYLQKSLKLIVGLNNFPFGLLRILLEINEKINDRYEYFD